MVEMSIAPSSDRLALGYPDDLVGVLRQRRLRLAQQGVGPVLLWSGQAPARNFAANRYPFRASSHFLYFAGIPIERAAILLESGRLTLFWDEPDPASALWHGPEPSRAKLALAIGADAAYPWSALADHLPVDVATVALPGPIDRQAQAEILGRPVEPLGGVSRLDVLAIEAIVAVRLIQDEAAIAALVRSAQVAMAAHRAGLATTARARTEAEVRAVIEGIMLAHQCQPAYNSIVTTHGEILHNDRYGQPLQPGDLLLVDAGAELASGWASDITRTWPVSGQWSASQRDLYDVVLAAHDVAIAAIQPDVEYRHIHLAAAQVLAEGWVELGILRGDPAELVDRDAHALFFPHGIGHLLGLDVHDMEDLGDWAGYAPGRQRSDRFGLGFLRLDRPLAAGMVVTIEPGFYQVPALLNDPVRRDRYADCVNWDRLAQFADTRGIRIEDDVLVTEHGAQVLTAALPTKPEAIADLVQAA